MTASVIVRRGRIVSIEVDALEVYVDDGVRMAAVTCPRCSKRHEHVVPADTLPTAIIERSPKCGAHKGVYTIRM